MTAADSNRALRGCKKATIYFNSFESPEQMPDFIAIDEIKLKPRQRSEMDKAKFEALVESIRVNGLLHAVVLDHEDALLVGERRFRAMCQLHKEETLFKHNGRPVPIGKIPFTRNWINDEIALREIELTENIEREDLAWPDRVKAMAEIHRLKKAKNPEQTFVGTAREIVDKAGSGNANTMQHEVSRSLITADFLDDPNVAKARNEKEAFNAAIRKLRESFAAKIPVRPSNHLFIEGDAVAVLGELIAAKKKFSCFIVDPPYGVDAQTFINKTTTLHSYDDSPEYAMGLNKSIIRDCFELGADNSHLWLFCDVDHFLTLRKVGTESGWLVFPTPIVWNSGVRGHIPNQKIGIRRNHEFLMFMLKGDRGLSQIFDDVINGIPGGHIEYHAAEKPKRLYELLLRLSTVTGDGVLDPCCGSGTVFRAAHSLNLHATGVDNNPEYAKFCRAVIAELSQEPKTQKQKDDLEDF